MEVAQSSASDPSGERFGFMLWCTKQQRSLLEAMAYHEAGYLVAASVAQVQSARRDALSVAYGAPQVMSLISTRLLIQMTFMLQRW